MVTMPSQDIQDKLRERGILVPIDPDASKRWQPAPRLASLHGKVGGFLGNKKDNAALILSNLKELLDKQYELDDAIVVEKYIYSRPAAPDIVDALAGRCDFVVTATAD